MTTPQDKTRHTPEGLSRAEQAEWLDQQKVAAAEREYRRQVLNEGNWDDLAAVEGE